MSYRFTGQPVGATSGGDSLDERYAGEVGGAVAAAMLKGIALLLLGAGLLVGIGFAVDHARKGKR